MKDPVRELEIKLIEVAIKERHALRNIFDRGALAQAIDALVFGCPECNQGGHTCPGDGNPIPHGATNCGEHEEAERGRITPGGFCFECTDGDEDPIAWCDCRNDEFCTGPCRRRAHSPANCPARTEWVESTFAHIKKGDRLRLGADEAEVLMVSLNTWHADVSNPRYPRPWEHAELYADLRVNGGDPTGRAPWPTTLAVEILCDAERKAELIMSDAGLKPRRAEGDS